MGNIALRFCGLSFVFVFNGGSSGTTSSTPEVLKIQSRLISNKVMPSPQNIGLSSHFFVCLSLSGFDLSVMLPCLRGMNLEMHSPLLFSGRAYMDQRSFYPQVLGRIHWLRFVCSVVVFLRGFQKFKIRFFHSYKGLLISHSLSLKKFISIAKIINKIFTSYPFHYLQDLE